MTQPITLFAEISRIDEDARIVEGYCYTREQVKSDPWTLPFGVLRAASEDYLQWAAVREMHDAKAAGNCLDLKFEDAEKRIFIRAEIVDDEAWKKVKKRVYKGFSIGGRPTMVRGTTVEKFTWTETSLVDRPADHGAAITLFRREDVADEPEEAEAEVAREDGGQPDYAAGQAGPDLPVPEIAQTEVQKLVGMHHYDCGAKSCHGHKQEAAARRCMDAQMERADIHIPDEADTEEVTRLESAWDEANVTRSEEPATDPPAAPEAAPDPGAEPEDPDMATVAELTERLDKAEKDNASLLARLDALTPVEDVKRLEELLTETRSIVDTLKIDELKAEIKRIGDQPAGTPPVRFPQAMTPEAIKRLGAANAESVSEEAAKKVTRLQAIEALPRTMDAAEQNARVDEHRRLSNELMEMGYQYQ